MQTKIDDASKRAAKNLPVNLNFNKLAAVLCMAASAAISVAMSWGSQ